MPRSDIGQAVIEGRTRSGLHKAHPEPYGTDGPRESRCDACGSRVTETLSGWEAGHEYGCPNRPDELGDTGSDGGASQYTATGGAD